MKKYLLIGVVIILALVGYLGFKNSSLFQVSVEQTAKPEDVVISNWNTYTNSNLGLEISYPAGFVVNEQGRGYSNEIVFETDSVLQFGKFGITFFDTSGSKINGKINTLDDVPRWTQNEFNRVISSKKEITNNYGVTAQIVRGILYIFENDKINTQKYLETVSILFINNTNAYELEWSCWDRQHPCFNDQIIEKVVSSIKFSK
jgi:hypothetical protein